MCQAKFNFLVDEPHVQGRVYFAHKTQMNDEKTIDFLISIFFPTKRSFSGIVVKAHAGLRLIFTTFSIYTFNELITLLLSTEKFTF